MLDRSPSRNRNLCLGHIDVQVQAAFDHDSSFAVELSPVFWSVSFAQTSSPSSDWQPSTASTSHPVSPRSYKIASSFSPASKSQYRHFLFSRLFIETYYLSSVPHRQHQLSSEASLAASILRHPCTYYCCIWILTFILIIFCLFYN